MSRNLIEEIKKEVQSNKKCIVLPETEDERVIRAAAKILKQGFANLILIGSKDKVESDAKKYGVDIAGVKIIDQTNFDKIDDFANEYAKLRAKKKV